MKRVLLLIIFVLVTGCFARWATQDSKLSEIAIEEPKSNDNNPAVIHHERTFIENNKYGR
jgi:hypothetical protein